MAKPFERIGPYLVIPIIGNGGGFYQDRVIPAQALRFLPERSGEDLVTRVVYDDAYFITYMRFDEFLDRLRATFTSKPSMEKAREASQDLTVALDELEGTLPA